jgi:4,5:9,10-diseco-3-hydroxy-5,9,17-trioxoandrosta-1(10),2-diene-4-oate hydrolase
VTNSGFASVKSGKSKGALAMWNERYVNVDGVRTRYVFEGVGPSVLLIHGFGEFLEIWGYNISPLSQYFSIYAMDLPGHGLSGEPAANYTLNYSAEFTLGFMGALGIERASLVGHSLGGLLCLKVAIDFPEKVDKLVLVDSAGLSKEAPLIYRLATLPVLGNVLLKPTVKKLIRHGIERGFYNPETVTDEWVDLSYKYQRMPKMKHTLLNLIRSNARIDGLHPETLITDRLHLVKAPTLLIHGAQDRVIPAEYARLACKLIPNVTCQVFDECGHCPHIEKAPQFNQAVITFLKADKERGKIQD